MRFSMVGKVSRIVVACVAVLGTQAVAVARDNGGNGDFFSHIFGFDSPAPPQTAPIWSEEDPFDRPLTVRPHTRSRSKARVAAKPVIGPMAPVTIYQDTTLRPGDAVMTAAGMRIFQGSNSLPHTDADFVPVSAKGRLPKDVAKTLMAMDRVPRL